MPSQRYFTIARVVKPGQSDVNTKFNETMLFTGTPDRAAKKAMSRLCSVKDVRGQCTLTISVMEVLKKTIDGSATIVPKLDSNGDDIVRKYTVKRQVIDDNVNMGGTSVHFKYTTKITKSFGRV
jgi:hypothetical protein